eukprot:SAG22_NODE_4073_length_1396_cov_1.814187_1_plen_39_part_10
MTSGVRKKANGNANGTGQTAAPLPSSLVGLPPPPPPPPP